MKKALFISSAPGIPEEYQPVAHEQDARVEMSVRRKERGERQKRHCSGQSAEDLPEETQDSDKDGKSRRNRNDFHKFAPHLLWFSPFASMSQDEIPRSFLQFAESKYTIAIFSKASEAPAIVFLLFAALSPENRRHPS